MKFVSDPDSLEARGGAAAVLPTVQPGDGRTGLDRRTILAAAVVVIDRDGLRSFTMRRLGDYLGVEAMAIYHHLPGREAVLDGVVDLVVDELYGDPDVHLGSVEWQDFLQRLAHGVRRIALAHPEVFPLVATRPPQAPWIKPPIRSLRWIQEMLVTLRRCGFSDAAAVAAYQGFSSFLLGHLLLEVSAQGADTGPVDAPDPEEGDRQNGLAEYPLLQQLEPLLTVNRSAEEFEKSLESLLDRLEVEGKR